MYTYPGMLIHTPLVTLHSLPQVYKKQEFPPEGGGERIFMSGEDKFKLEIFLNILLKFFQILQIFEKL